jgi:glycosyltransferase involved in cell wall biosynthesis
MNSNPLVSTIISVYNCEHYLAEAIKSVFVQTYRPIEVIVVDDGSTDKSADIARSYNGIHYIYQSNQGAAVARNTGITHAHGEFIAFLDADDMWVPHKLTMQVEYLFNHPAVGYTVGRIQNFNCLGNNSNSQARQSSLEKEQIGLITMVARKTVFEQVGGFDPSYRIGSDFEWVVRAKDAGISMVILPEILLHRRIHDSNLSHQTQARCTSLLRMFKESINRKDSRNDNNGK